MLGLLQETWALKFVGLKPSRKIKLSTPVLKLDWWNTKCMKKKNKFQTQESDSIPHFRAVIRSSKTKNTVVSKIKIIIDYKTHNSSLFQGGWWIINF
jgi:hypothetical protein